MVGMGHLQPPAIVLEFAGDDTRLANRKQLLQIVRAGMEKNQFERSGIVVAAHPVGNTALPAWRRSVLCNRHFDCCQFTGDCLSDFWPCAPVDQGGGKVKQEIGDFRVFVLRMGR